MGATASSGAHGSARAGSWQGTGTCSRLFEHTKPVGPPHFPAGGSAAIRDVMNFNTLSGRFAFLTVVFVLLAEVLILVPSVTNYRRDYLETRLERAQSTLLLGQARGAAITALVASNL